MPERDLLARALAPGCAGRAAWIDAAGLAAEHGLDHDTASVESASLDVADDLMAGSERKAHDLLEVAGASTVQGGEVGAADAGQSGADANPVGTGHLGSLDLDELERTDTDAFS